MTKHLRRSWQRLPRFVFFLVVTSTAFDLGCTRTALVISKMIAPPQPESPSLVKFNENYQDGTIYKKVELFGLDIEQATRSTMTEALGKAKINAIGDNIYNVSEMLQEKAMLSLRYVNQTNELAKVEYTIYPTNIQQSMSELTDLLSHKYGTCHFGCIEVRDTYGRIDADWRYKQWKFANVEISLRAYERLGSISLGYYVNRFKNYVLSEDNAAREAEYNRKSSGL